MMAENLEWYVLEHDFNSDQIRQFNIFNSVNFDKWLNVALKKYETYEKFREDLRSALFYAFCSKAEYEIICKGLVSIKDNEFKIDVYEQVLPNLDILAKYILTEVNKKKRKKLIF